MINEDTLQNKAAKAAMKAEETSESFIDDPKKEIKRRASQAAGDATYAVNSLFGSIEDSTRRSPGCALLFAGLLGICIGRHYYRK